MKLHIFCDRKNNLLPVFFCITFLFLIVFSCQTAASAKSFTVRSGYDVADLTPGNGLCVAYLVIIPPYVFPYCTLRAAIQETNALPGADTIKLPSGTFHLTLEGQGEDQALTGDLDITDDLTIIGEGAGNTFISADELDRVLDVIPPDITVTIIGVSFIRGQLNAGLPADQQGGAGIRNRATLNLIRCSVENNTLAGKDSGDNGAGLFNQGICAISSSTFQGNLSGQEAGAVFNDREAKLIISASTLYDNQADNGGGISNYGTASLVNTTISNNQAANGGGIYNTGQMEIRQSTIAVNTATNGAGIINDYELSLANTLFASNEGKNCVGNTEIISQGGNLDDSNSCMMTITDTDIAHINPRIHPLDNNGGLTLTHRIYYSSPARDKGISIPAITVDQRGHSRLADRSYDIGAFEVALPIPPLISRLLLVQQQQDLGKDVP